VCRVLIPCIFSATLATATAHDTQYPARGQQIPSPECMNLHFAPGYDRSGGVGFRCVVDAQ
jgi:hypothetical protein